MKLTGFTVTQGRKIPHVSYDIFTNWYGVVCYYRSVINYNGIDKVSVVQIDTHNKENLSVTLREDLSDGDVHGHGNGC